MHSRSLFFVTKPPYVCLVGLERITDTEVEGGIVPLGAGYNPPFALGLVGVVELDTPIKT